MTNTSGPAAALETGEQLNRQLTTPQLAMIAIGGAIGTGLFLGSSLAVRVAGPGVIFSYLIGAVLALLLMGALSEMAVAHPTAGSFGVYAELYLNQWAGFVSRAGYWAAICLSVGASLVASATYMRYWLPGVPPLVWVALFSRVLLLSSSGRQKYAPEVLQLERQAQSPHQRN